MRLLPISSSPSKKRRQLGPLFYLILVFLVFYFMWKDFDLYVFIQECNKEAQNFTGCFAKEDVSIKHLMLPPNMHYLELPLAEWLEHTFKLSNMMSPNFVSFSGVAVGFSAAFLISQGHRWSILAGVIVYKLRDIADGLDGILARSLGKVKLSKGRVQNKKTENIMNLALFLF